MALGLGHGLGFGLGLRFGALALALTLSRRSARSRFLKSARALLASSPRRSKSLASSTTAEPTCLGRARVRAATQPAGVAQVLGKASRASQGEDGVRFEVVSISDVFDDIKEAYEHEDEVIDVRRVSRD